MLVSKNILKQSSKLGAFALISRCLAFLREILQIRFLSVGDSSDIFYTAFRIPNTMRKIFAEGALSSVLVPSMVKAKHHDGEHGLYKLTTLSFVILEFILFVICALIFFHAPWCIKQIAPGFNNEKIYASAQLLKILISFILFFSSSAIFSAALQAQHIFLMPAIAPSISNILYISSLLICLYFNLSIQTFCHLMIFTAFIFFLTHLAAYLCHEGKIETPDQQTFMQLKRIMILFLPCFLSAGILEINHFINTGFASYLPSGSLTLLRSAYQFINIPIGIITASLTTVLLPHFSKIHLESPRELSSHMIDAIKFIIWTTLPICILFAFFSKTIFQTLFFGDAIAMTRVHTIQSIFLAFVVGLLFFSLNKILLSIFYTMQLTMVPLLSTLMSIAINFILNHYLMQSYGIVGIAFSLSIAAIAQTLFFVIFLQLHLGLNWPKRDSLNFFINTLAQQALCITICMGLFYICQHLIQKLTFSCKILCFTLNSSFLIDSIGLWIWGGPLALAYLYLLYRTREKFQITLNYLDK